MRNLILIGFILFSSVIYACSCSPGWGYPFCHHIKRNPTNIVISGLIIDTTAHSIRIKVIDRLKGVELRDTITIWDGTDWDCNGLVSMKATGLGSPGASIVTIIPLITSIENTWDIIGDYRRPEHLCTRSTLSLFNDSVFGLINGDPYSMSPQTEWTMKTSYSNFKAEFSANNESCLLLSIDDPTRAEKVSVIQRSNESIDILLANEDDYSAELVSSAGQKIESYKFRKDLHLNISNLNAGIYILVIRNDTRILATKKVYR